MVSTRVTLSGWTLDNPIIAASGAFGYGAEPSEYYDINRLGAFSFKGTTLLPRFGNPTPRIAETASGMLNSVGLQNPGIEHVLSHELPDMKRYYHKKVIANISGFSANEYAECCRMLDGHEQIGLIEVNISCPNVHGGGMAFGTTAEGAAEVTRAARAATKMPIYIKLSPNVSDIAEIARACEGEGADGISLINTLLGMRISLKTRRPVLANVMGGLSGPAIFPVALRMVYQASRAVSIPVIGGGGVASAEDALEMMMAGATAVEVGAQNLIDPYACMKIIDELPLAMERYGVNDINEIIGGAGV